MSHRTPNWYGLNDSELFLVPVFHRIVTIINLAYRSLFDVNRYSAFGGRWLSIRSLAVQLSYLVCVKEQWPWFGQCADVTPALGAIVISELGQEEEEGGGGKPVSTRRESWSNLVTMIWRFRRGASRDIVVTIDYIAYNKTDNEIRYIWCETITRWCVVFSYGSYHWLCKSACQCKGS